MKLFPLQEGPCLARDRFWFSAVRHPFEHLASAYYQGIAFMHYRRQALGRYELNTKVYE